MFMIMLLQKCFNMREQLINDILDLYANVSDNSQEIDEYKAYLNTLTLDELKVIAIDSGLLF